MSQIHIVSNRLPVEVKIKKKELNFHQSVGGLATGLQSLLDSQKGTWSGWPGITNEDLKKIDLNSAQQKISKKLQDFHSSPIFLSRKELNGYYYGFSNQTLNPLFHYFPQYAVYKKEYWDSYKKINEKFAQEILKKINPQDTVWVHDYHLFLLPQLLRQKMPDLSIGFFLHIPFPTSELFRTLPWREEMLKGVLGADLIGFHTHNYVRHFLQAINSILGLEHDLGRFNWQNRAIKVDTFPMGIDYQYFKKLASSKNKKSHKNKLDLPKGKNLKLILSVDRLDYAKGILQKIKAFEKLIKENKELLEKVTLMLVVVPSRTKVSHYQQLKKDIDEEVGRINGRYSSLDWSPIWYLSQKFSQEELIDFYQQSTVLLITSFRDGMNLIAKEYVASKNDLPGVIVISEQAGATREMPESLSVNPHDIDDITQKLKMALSMPDSEQKERLKALQKRFAYYDVFWWAKSFLDQLKATKRLQQQQQTRTLSFGIKKRIMNHYHEAQKRLLILDYDGTLIDLKSKPELAVPNKELLKILKELSASSKNKIVILSGRDLHFLEHHLGHLPLTLIAEHGQAIKKPNQDWTEQGNKSFDWMDDIKPILELYVDRTPGSFIEEKKFGLAWHYRQVDNLLAKIRVKELKDDLRNFTSNFDLGFIDGNKVVEIKPSHLTKGTVTQDLLAEDEFNFVLAIGDDTTDEDIYENLPDFAYSIKVGKGSTRARFRVDSSQEVISLIKDSFLKQ